VTEALAKIDAVSAGDLAPPKRVSFNFADRCNMACSFCYVPFDNLRVTADVATRVMNVILNWSPLSITVGGGDPLMYGFTPDLLRLVRSTAGASLFLQLDSNLMRPERSDISGLAHSIDMLGIPLDTFDEAVAWQMRGNPGHPRKMRAAIPEIVGEGICVKINTVVARPNLKCLPGLADFVAEARVRAWSLYEFWPIGPKATANRIELAVSHDEFLAGVSAACERVGEVHVETGGIEARRNAYFFVTPVGRAYTVDRNDHFRYVELGNVLTDERGVLRRWHQHADEVVNEERVQQRSAWAYQSEKLRIAGCHS
jgi:MoaA/NifB/PqqE/SkfB family radical SAM enzyme